ncbi:MAG: hypothetical protein M1829_003877 [Trizodia sp. TS-e1964]|nr:MAG: hypothetical protein M1829_003877 [Trizodia sp. TS-e1964]
MSRPRGVRLKATNADRSGPVLAGYLELPDTNALRLWLAAPGFNDILTQLKIRAATRAYVPKRVFVYTSNSEQFASILHSRSDFLGPPHYVESKFLVPAYYANAIARIIKGCAETFDRWPGGVTNPDNVYRAYCAIKFATKEPSGHTSKNIVAIQPEWDNTIYEWSNDESDEAAAIHNRFLSTAEQVELLDCVSQKLSFVDESLLGPIRVASHLDALRYIADSAWRAASEDAINGDTGDDTELDTGDGTRENIEDDVEAEAEKEIELDPKEIFLTLQNKVNDCSADNPTYQDSCRSLGLDPDSPFLEALSKKPLRLKPWQITGIAWMHQQERGPIAGGIIADGCGLGKTIQTLSYIYLDFKLSGKNQTTLVLAPGNVLDTWIKEYKKYFADLYSLRLYHGDETSNRQYRHNLLISSDELATILIDDPPETTVVLTSYTTWVIRLKNLEAPYIYRVICDEGHKVKNPHTASHDSIKSLSCERRWFLTATPLINKVTDILGYLSILFQPEWRRDQTADDSAISHYQKAAAFDPIEDKLHLLDPTLFKKLIKKGTLSRYNASKSLPRIFEMIQLRRTVATRMVIPPDNVCYVGGEIPQYHVETIELCHEPSEREKFCDFYADLEPYLVHRGRPQREKSDEAQKFDESIRRRLCHLSTSILLEKLVQAVKENQSSNVEQWRSKPQHGLLWFLSNVKEHSDAPLPITALPLKKTLALYMAGGSPKLRYLAKLLKKIVVEMDEQVILVTEWPMVAWFYEMFLELVGILFLSIRSAQTNEERSHALNRFNLPESDIKVLVTTYTNCAVGLNIQQCSHMIILEAGRSVDSELQMFGRIHRVGQQKVQNIWRLFCDGTFDRWVEANSANKMAIQIAGTAKIDGDRCSTEPDSEGDRIIQSLLGQRRSRLLMGDRKDIG